MATSRYLSVHEIAELVEGYEPGETAESEIAFRRMFERDKEELRKLGVPLETGTPRAYDDEIGYRIPRRDYALPDLHLDADEAAALGLAARLWSSASLATASAGALRKLEAAGVDPRPPPTGREPRGDAPAPAGGPPRAGVRAPAGGGRGGSRSALRLPPAWRGDRHGTGGRAVGGRVL